MSKIHITPLAAESFGVRSMATFVQTPDIKLVIDPGCSLGQRSRLDPHPQEYNALFAANQRLIEACAKAEILAISHFHYDHLKPTFTDYHFILSNSELAKIIFTDKLILAKDFRENINASQRQRGYYFNKFVSKYADEIRWADGQSFEFGDTNIRISNALSHGEFNSPQGFVISFNVIYNNESFVYATVQGPILKDTLTYLLSLNPTSLYVGGPPLYLSGFRVSESTINQARNNMIALIKNIPRVIVDHHLLRDASWKEWLSSLFEAASNCNHWLGTAADFAAMPNHLLEAFRKELYIKDPPSHEFLKWTKQADQFKKENLPPSLYAPF